MTIRDYYRRVALVPVAVPLVLAVLEFGFGVRNSEMRILEVGSALGLVPYLVALFLVRRRMAQESEKELVRLSLVAPLLFTAVLWVFLTPIALGNLIAGRGNPLDVLGAIFFGIGVFAVGIGYGYVFVLDGVLLLLLRLGVVRREEAATG